MVKIRLMRMGKKKQPYYRVVVADARSPRDGRFIENIGRYHPRAHPSVIEIDSERALHWLRTGAQPSDPVRVLFQKTGIWGQYTGEGPTEAVAPPPEKERKPAKTEAAEEGPAAEAPAAAEALEAPAEAEAEAPAETEAPAEPAEPEAEPEVSSEIETAEGEKE
ncbi:MAG: 30S ribosomal protein S16 [Actinomycetota bacterium]|nr:30S ribosomal protein S16 [Actinomycetota bacterium]